MPFVKPEFKPSGVRRAGEWLADKNATSLDKQRGTLILTNWRAAHGHPLNTFQATLRKKLARIDSNAIVGQRLKRAPSVIAKLERFGTMKLAQMQDIAGLRAIVSSMPKLRKLQGNYLESRFAHELIKTNDYVDSPKPDGYRSIHLVYRYKSDVAPEYDGLHVELQLRTKLQHAWATAVETVDAYLGESIKAGRPGDQWAEFFKLASAAFSHLEGTKRVQELEHTPIFILLAKLSMAERQLGLLLRLRGYSVATNHIIKSGNSRARYHLIVLNTKNRVANVRSFPMSEQQAAHIVYAEHEERARGGEPIDAVLVTGGTVEQLRKSYPNYFLDTDEFVKQIEKLLRTPIRDLGAK